MSQSPDGLPPLGEVVRALGLSTRKSLGQHFILDLNVTRRIARAAGPLAGRTVVEVGPGPGGLTRALFLEGAERVIAVERDERCRPALEAIAARYPGRLDAHFGDAMETDWTKLASPRARQAEHRRQSALQRGDPAAHGLAGERAVASVVRAHGADVPEGGGRAGGGRPRHQGLWTPFRVGAVAHKASVAVRLEAGGVRAASGGRFRCRRVQARRAAATRMLGQRRWPSSRRPPSASAEKCCARASRGLSAIRRLCSERRGFRPLCEEKCYRSATLPAWLTRWSGGQAGDHPI